MRWKPGKEVLCTKHYINTETLHLFLLHMYSYYSILNIHLYYVQY